MGSVIRRIFGNSNRSGHLKMSRVASGVAAFTGALLGASFNPLLFLPCGLIAANACLHQEYWASADRDQAETGYWGLYDQWFRHRSIWSHGLIIGTVTRLLYGYWGIPFILCYLIPPTGISWVIGAFINDVGHIILDL